MLLYFHISWRGLLKRNKNWFVWNFFLRNELQGVGELVFSEGLPCTKHQGRHFNVVSHLILKIKQQNEVDGILIFQKTEIQETCAPDQQDGSTRARLHIQGAWFQGILFTEPMEEFKVPYW